jgi:DNA polymerase-1
LRDKKGLKGPPVTGLKAIATAFVHDVFDETDWRYGVLTDYKDICLLQQEESLYYKKYPLLVHPRDGRLHPQFKNCGTATRRPTGTAPNDLQVSKKDGAKMRKCYVGGDYGDGQRVYVSCDYAGQELMITAVASQDPVMLDAFTSSPRKDLHSLTSSGFAHILLPRLGVLVEGKLEYEQFVAGLHSEDKKESSAYKEVRNKYGKPCGFLIVYGGGHTTLAENLQIQEELAKQIMDSTFETYSRLKPWQEEVSAFAKKHGYVETAYGNRRHVEKELFSSENGLVKRQERQLSNYQIQGMAADILKIVRQTMFDRKFIERFRLRAIKPVYDEISASVPIDLAADYALELTEVMSLTPPGYPVPMPVELSIGPTWGDVKEVEIDREAIEQRLETIRSENQK